MGTPLKFEFDFDEVFEGIKLGVIKQMSEMTFDSITNSAINQVKAEMKNKITLTYKDEYDIRDEMKKEIKEKVYNKLVEEIRADYKQKYEDAFSKDITKVFNDAEKEMISDIKNKTINKLYDNLYSSVQNQVKFRINSSVTSLIDTITGNDVRVDKTNKSITKEEYEELVNRSKTLEALEQGGVDNWEWYGESLNNYFGEDRD